MKRALLTLSFVAVFSIAIALPSAAQGWQSAWLRYAPLPGNAAAHVRSPLPARLVTLGDSPILESAQRELVRGLHSMLGETLQVERGVGAENAFVLGTMHDLHRVIPTLKAPSDLHDDGFWLTTTNVRKTRYFVIAATNHRGVLYGVFALLGKIARLENVAAINAVDQPVNRIRAVDEWDNLNGSVERGYGGPSIFFEDGRVRDDLSRAAGYARLLASVGINTCFVNNVNADPRILQPAFLPQLSRIAEVFRPWGVKLGIAIDVSSPKTVGGLSTFDPLDPHVAVWWKQTVDGIYAAIPDFAGFVVKADSEGRAGPASYGRTPADAANVIARALKPRGGLLFYRAFVYDHHLDWRNPKNDRARAAYDIFHPLDGQFEDNVVIQIKHGPVDFQVREPASPLFAGLDRTNESIELQITQEYMGQQKHLCYLVPMWKEALDFDMRKNGASTPVRDLVSGCVTRRPTGGFVGVSNVGMDSTWLGHPLALANLYGFARLAWNPQLSAESIAEEWTRLTFGNDPQLVKTIVAMQLGSWPIYESYTGNLGLQTLTDILGSHYGPGVNSSEENGWGQWHRADHEGVGMDRTVATGTGYVGQYPPQAAAQFESLATTPDNLLLFFHHVPYTYRLHDGKTVIQEIYDAHYEGAERAAGLAAQWQSLKNRMEEARYEDVLRRLEYQAGHAIVWRDAVCNWFARASGIPDAHGRVGHYPGRIEAESMQLEGYLPFDMTPEEDASGGKGVECPEPLQLCSAKFQFTGTPGQYELDVEYFDQRNGASRFRVFIAGKLVAQWTADMLLPSLKPNADSSTRYRIPGLTLDAGDEVRIEGVPDNGERAALDYVELLPDARP